MRIVASIQIIPIELNVARDFQYRKAVTRIILCIIVEPNLTCIMCRVRAMCHLVCILINDTEPNLQVLDFINNKCLETIYTFLFRTTNIINFLIFYKIEHSII